MKEKRRHRKIVCLALTICLAIVTITATVLAVVLLRQNSGSTTLSTQINSTKSSTPLTTTEIVSISTVFSSKTPELNMTITSTDASFSSETPELNMTITSIDASFSSETPELNMAITSIDASFSSETPELNMEITSTDASFSTKTTSEIYADMTSSDVLSSIEALEELTTEMMSTQNAVESTETFSFLNNQTMVSTYSATIEDSTSVLVNCVYPFALSPSGTCVNLLIDFLNCGTVGYICPSNYTSCSNGLCSVAPSVQLTDPIPIFTAALNGSVDDTFYEVTVPFQITLYGITTQQVRVTTNGVLCLETCSNVYTETILPTSEFSGATALAYWDDLYIFQNTSQGIYYQTDGNTPNRTLTFEYYCSHYMAGNEYYHFQVVFFENKPGVVQYIYYDISDKGANCTVGVQASSTGPYMQYSFQRKYAITNNMTLTFDTNSGTYTRN